MPPTSPPPDQDNNEDRNWIRSPLCRLSEDLIIDILHRLMPSDDDIVEAAKTMRVHAWIMPVVTVCRRLRAIGLDVPRLWATVSLGHDLTKKHRAWFYLCFSRAQEHPLVLVVRLHSPTLQAKQVLRLRSRTRALYLETPDSCFDLRDESAYASLMSRPWPLLARLTLCHGHNAASTVMVNQKPAHTLSTRLLVNSGQTLTYLCLRGLWSIGEALSSDRMLLTKLPIFSRLEVLEIQQCLVGEWSALHMSLLLRTTPRLEVLRLALCSEPDFEHHLKAPKHSPVATLPHLRYIFVEGDLCSVAAILHVLPFPTKRLEVSADCDLMRVSPESVGQIVSKCHKYLQGATQNTAVYSYDWWPNISNEWYEDTEGEIRGYVSVESRSPFENDGRELLLRITRATHIDVLLQAITLVDRIELRSCRPRVQESELVLQAIAEQCPSHVVTELYLAGWRGTWMWASNSSVLKDCLRSLKKKGHPLTVLELEIENHASGPASKAAMRWHTVIKGMVGDIQFIQKTRAPPLLLDLWM